MKKEELQNIKDLLNSESIEDVILGLIILKEDESIFHFQYPHNYGSYDVAWNTKSRFGIIIYEKKLFFLTRGMIYRIGEELYDGYTHVNRYYDDGTISFE